MIIGIDPHKMSHTANAVNPATNSTAASLRIDASPAGYRELMRWAKQFPERRWAVENARGLGRHLAQWLVARGEVVLDVPSTATARVRELSRGSRRKIDVIDDAAAASVAARHGDATVVIAEDYTTVFALLEERRANVAAQRVRIANQLHAVLRDLAPGGAALALTPKSAATLLRSIRPESPTERTRKELAQDLVRELRAVDASLADIEARMTVALDEHGTRLREIDGIGAVRSHKNSTLRLMVVSAFSRAVRSVCWYSTRPRPRSRQQHGTNSGGHSLSQSRRQPWMSTSHHSP
jgi:transposase